MDCPVASSCCRVRNTSQCDSVRLATLIAILILLGCPGQGFTESQASGQDEKADSSPSLGVTQMIEQIVLPGTLLTHKKVDPTTSPLMVRVVRSFPHGDAFRYDISYFGMDAGNYDLRDFLVREDGSSIDDLPEIPVTINTILEEGHIEPNQLEVGSLSRYGGYWQLLWLGAIVWIVILLAMVFVGRGKKSQEVLVFEKKVTLAELLKPSVEKAIDGSLPQEKHAELERLLFAFWQRKLVLDDLEPAQALHQIRNNEESGPLIRKIEAWLHSPPGTQEEIDVAELLKPYQKYQASELEDHDEAGGEQGGSK